MWSSACAALLGSSPLLPTNHRDSPRRVPPPVPTVNHKFSEPTQSHPAVKTAPEHIDLGALHTTRSGVSIRQNRTIVWWGEVGTSARGRWGTPHKKPPGVGPTWPGRMSCLPRHQCKRPRGRGPVGETRVSPTLKEGGSVGEPRFPRLGPRPSSGFFLTRVGLGTIL